MTIKDLYITDSVQNLNALAQTDEIIHNLKKINLFSQIAKKLMDELLQCQDDQERCYIICKRYLNIMDHLFKISDDQNFSRLIHLNDYNKVKEIAGELREQLDRRYKALSKAKNEIKSPVSSPTTQIPYINNLEVTDAEIFKDKFIQPSDLFSIIQNKTNFLVVDIRSKSEFENCRIKTNNGDVLNIPGEHILPGLSANTLGQRLDDPLKEIWDRRDKYNIIILLDNDTQKYNYVGSKLEKLRSFIVEWDALRHYKQEPVVLNGGLREFVEWYPSSVDNSHVYLPQTNADIDELLDLDSIIYPESGSTKQMNLKFHSVNSHNNLENRVKRDFDNGDQQNFESLSEGDLPLDYYSSKENLPHSPFKSLSEEDLSNDLSSQESDIFPSGGEGEKIQAPRKELNDDAEIKEIMEGDKAALLRKARQAAKPSLPVDDRNGDKGDRRKDRFESDIGSGSREHYDIDRSSGSRDKDHILTDTESRIRDRSPFSRPPTIDRSFKPVFSLGDGFTGLRNVKNICYMNCLLQCLKVIPMLKSIYVSTDKYMAYTTRKPPKINDHFAQVLRELWGGTLQKPKIFLIQKFKDRICEFAPMYDRNTHEDCFEFFMYLFNAISEDCSSDLPRLKIMTESEKAWYGHLQGRSSIWVDNFYYQLKNTKFCVNCRKMNLSFETDSTLMLPVASRPSHLKHMITEYLRENRLTDFSCSSCKFTGAIINKKELAVEPEVLVIVLKRYIANLDGTFRKNEAEVGFPLTDLQFGNSIYNLYGVVQHSGGMTSGHYYATVLLNQKRDTWVLFNDETITVYSSPINEISSLRSSAAGFFYVRDAK